MKIEIEGDWPLDQTDTQDGGQAKIFQIEHNPDVDNGLFVRIQSWDDTRKHELFKQIEGKRIRVTIETLD